MVFVGRTTRNLGFSTPALLQASKHKLKPSNVEVEVRMVKTSGVKKLMKYLEKAGPETLLGGLRFERRPPPAVTRKTKKPKTPALKKSTPTKAAGAKKTASLATPVTATKQRSSKQAKSIAATAADRVFEQKTVMPVCTFGADGKPEDEPEGVEGGLFMFPYGIAVDGINGNVIIADTSNNRVQVLKKTESGALSVVKVFGSGAHALGWENPGEPEFNTPCGVTVDKKGNLLVIDSLKDRVQVFGADGKILRMFGTEGHKPGQFCEPCDLAVDEEGDVIVADRYNHCVSIFSEDGTFKKRLGHGKGSASGQLLEPCGVAVDTAGNVVIADTANHRLQVMTKEGTLLRTIEKTEAGPFKDPWGVAVDPWTGHILVADSLNHRVQVLTGDGGFVRSFGSEGAAEGQFNCPRGVALDREHVFVLDTNNKRVQVFARMY